MIASILKFFNKYYANDNVVLRTAFSDLPTKRDQAALNKVTQMEDQKSHSMSVYREPPPLQFYFKHLTQHLRIILVNGDRHTLINSLSQPKPKILYIDIDEIDTTTETSLMEDVKKFIVSHMNKSGFNPFKALALLAPSTTSIHGLAPVLANQPKASRLHLVDSRNLSELPDWYYGAGVRQYNIDPADTYVVVIRGHAPPRKNPGIRPWIYPNEMRKIWPDFTVEVQPGVHKATMLDLLQQQDLMEMRQEMLDTPGDIIHHPLRYEYRPHDEEWGLVESSSSSSSTSSSSSSDYPTVKTFSGDSLRSGSRSGSGSVSVSSGDSSGSPGSGDFRRRKSSHGSGRFKFGSEDSLILNDISETDLRYLKEHKKPLNRTLMLYPPKVNSQTALDVAKFNVFGNLAKP